MNLIQMTLALLGGGLVGLALGKFVLLKQLAKSRTVLDFMIRRGMRRRGWDYDTLTTEERASLRGRLANALRGG